MQVAESRTLGIGSKCDLGGLDEETAHPFTYGASC